MAEEKKVLVVRCDNGKKWLCSVSSMFQTSRCFGKMQTVCVCFFILSSVVWIVTKNGALFASRKEKKVFSSKLRRTRKKSQCLAEWI